MNTIPANYIQGTMSANLVSVLGPNRENQN